MADETIRQKLVFDAAQALDALEQINQAADTAGGKAALLNKKLQDYSRSLGQTWKQTLGQMKMVGDAEGLRFQTPLGLDVTEQVYQQAAALAQASQAKNKFITEDTKAAAAETNFDGSIKKVNASLGQEQINLQKVIVELERMQAQGKLSFVGTNQKMMTDIRETIRSVSAKTGASYEQVAKQLTSMGVPAVQARLAVKSLNEELSKGVKTATGFRHGIDVIRTALGTLTAVGIFTFINMITQSFSQASKAARELEDSLFRLSNVEKILSEGGIDVTMEGFRKGIQDIKKLFPIFSKEDITQLVAQIAISTKELGLTERQILDLAKAVAVLNVRSTEEETATQTAGKIISAIITDQARGISALGLSFKENEIQLKAMEMGFLRAGESASNLTSEEKAQVKYQIVLENTNAELANMGEYLDTNTAKLKANAASWQDLLTTLGSIGNTLAPVLSPILQLIQDGLNAGKAILAVFIGIEKAIRSVVGLIPQFMNPFAELEKRQQAFENLKKSLTDIPALLRETVGNATRNLFPEIPANAPDWFKKLFGGFLEDVDTPTNPIKDLPDQVDESGQDAANAMEEAEEKIIDIMEDAREKRLQIDEDYRRKIEDANREHAQKMQDIARDVARKEEDALRDYTQKVEDVNRDAAEAVAEANADYRESEIEREAEYQQRLRELREQFLFDLEDALRERDARQVLRLIRQYNFDKKNLEERHKIEQEDAKRALARKLADIERERQLKLEAARREYAEKLAEIQIWAEREREEAAIALQRKLEDAREWHKRELLEYQQYLQQKLKALADSIIKEYQLTAAGAEAIYRLLQAYFGSGGAISQLLAQGLATNIGNILGSGGGGNNSLWSQLGYYGAAQGGTFIATRPTPLMVGEAGMEKVTVTPLTRTGEDVNKIFSSSPLGGQAGGMLNLRVALSDGLVAEIVDASLDGVAATIEKIRREK